MKDIEIMITEVCIEYLGQDNWDMMSYDEQKAMILNVASELEKELEKHYDNK